MTTIELQDWQNGVSEQDTNAEVGLSTLNQATQIEQVILKPIAKQTWNLMHSKSLADLSLDELNQSVPFNQSLVDSMAQLPNLAAVEIRDPWGGWPARTIESEQVGESLGQAVGGKDQPCVAKR